MVATVMLILGQHNSMKLSLISLKLSHKNRQYNQRRTKVEMTILQKKVARDDEHTKVKS